MTLDPLAVLIAAQQRILNGRRFDQCTLTERKAYDVLTSARCYLMNARLEQLEDRWGY